MKRFLVVLLVIALMSTGCSLNSSNVNETEITAATEDSHTDTSALETLEEEVRFYPAFDENYKTGNNLLFDFWFDIPVEWNAVDNSKDGSTFDILSGNDKVVIQISGEMINGDNEDEDDFCTSLAGKSGTVSEFRFRDRWVGKHIQVSANEAYYLRVDGDSYLILYINTKKDPEWKTQNEEILNNIAMSVRTARQSHGNHDTDAETIKKDDLQLGDISVGITYAELIEAMKQEPEDIEEENYEGFATKTLFFSDGTQVYIVDDIVYTVNVTSPDYVTPRGLKTGDSRQRLEELYGSPSNESDGILGYTYNGYELFTVVIEDDKVSQIQIDFGAGDVEIY